MKVPATLHVLRGRSRSSMIAASVDDAIQVAVVGEAAGDFTAVEITDWTGRRLEGSALRVEICRRLALRE